MISRPLAWTSLVVSTSVILAQEPAANAPVTRAPLPPLPAPLSVPQPGPTNDAPYAPQAILPGGIVIPLYPPGSPFLKADRVREAEQYNLDPLQWGRVYIVYI